MHELVEEVEQAFDRLYIMMAALSDGVGELEEIEFDYRTSDPAFMDEVRGLVKRYDGVASDARNQITEIRKQILASMNQHHGRNEAKSTTPPWKGRSLEKG